MPEILVTKYGKDYETERAAFKAECATQDLPCWLCHNTKGPIDYISEYDPENYNPLLFSLDHANPRALGYDPMRRAWWRASHLVCNIQRGDTTRGQYPVSRAW